MRRLRPIPLVLVMLLGLVCTTGPTASAAHVSLTGTCTQDDEVQMFIFTVTDPAVTTATLQTLSYAGGLNAAGAVVAPGGFDPVLTLFAQAGVLIGEDDDSSTVADPVTGLSLDAVVQLDLTAGRYVVSLTQAPNCANGPTVSDGFQLAGTGNLTRGFVDMFGNQRDGHWAIDLLNVAAAAPVVIPEPATLLLLSTGFGVLLARRWRQRA
jgi:hypothetical protein